MVVPPSARKERNDEMTKTTTGLCAAILALAATGALAATCAQAEQHRTDGMMGQPGMMGDAALSREEAQAVHDRMFDIADADRDGAVTMEEMHAMMGGGMMGGASK
jgi:hypothetical protein